LAAAAAAAARAAGQIFSPFAWFLAFNARSEKWRFGLLVFQSAGTVAIFEWGLLPRLLTLIARLLHSNL
jgi:hypothetical protein